ncbi:hypothetical protein I4U23_025933 [Adineta vaga]|nr:hypothetical protein I4U23_025933 [Adineta vaga]
MLKYFINLFFQRNLIMAFHSRNFVSITYNPGIHARAFDEIVSIQDLSSPTTSPTVNDGFCLITTSTKDTTT